MSLNVMVLESDRGAADERSHGADRGRSRRAAVPRARRAGVSVPGHRRSVDVPAAVARTSTWR